MTSVYVSSTFQDLQECRSAVLLALRRLRVVVPAAMEAYVAEEVPPLEGRLDTVAECDVYLGIFAWRYGFVPAGHDRSITELEYRHALALGKTCLIFLLDEDAPWPRIHIDRGIEAERIEELRRELAERHTCTIYRGPGDLASLVTGAVAEVVTETSPQAVRPGSLSPDTLGRYYERLRVRYRYLDLDALLPPQRNEHVAVLLNSIFVEPTLRPDATRGLSRESWNRIGAEGQDLGNVPAALRPVGADRQSRGLLEVIAKPGNRRLVLLGDPGSGKSTAARYVLLSLAQPAGAPIDDQLSPLEGHLPILVELRAYAGLLAQGECQTFIDYVDHLAGTVGLGVERATLQRYLDESNPVLVVFDGLDEVLEVRQRAAIAEQIAAFGAEFPHARVIVTSRVIGYSRHILNDAGFEQFTLDGLNGEQIDTFVANYYKAVMRDRPTDVPARQKRLAEAVRHSASIRDLAGNPLLLTILAIIGTHQDLPMQRWSLYHHASTVLAEQWDVSKHPSLVGGDLRIDVEDKMEILRLLAWRMQARPGLSANEVTVEVLIQVFESYVTERYALDQAEARRLTKSMISQLTERNFILTSSGPNLYGFVHRTFLEFFCADSVVHMFDGRQWTLEQVKELFVEHRNDPTWREILRLVVSTLDERIAGEVLTALMALDEPWPAAEFVVPPSNLALAVECLAEVRNLRRHVAGPARELLRRIILLIEHCVSIDDQPTMAMIENEILPATRALGTLWPGADEYVTWYRRRGVRLIWGSTSACAARLAAVLALPSDHIEVVFTGVLGYIDDWRASYAAVAGLAEMAHMASMAPNPSAFEQARTKARAHLIARARVDENTNVRLAAVEALGAVFEDPSVQEVLAVIAREDVSPHVRAAALRVLGARFRTDLSVQQLLVERSNNDSEADVRQVAVEQIEPLVHDPEVRAALIRRVLTDPSAEVMSVAAMALEGATSKLDVRAMLMERIPNEPEDLVRRAAVVFLAERAAAT